MALVDLIAGARPNFVKIASLIHACNDALAKGSTTRYRLIHTGQHYDRNMSGSFFEQLGIPDPHINLEVGSGTHAEQTANIMVRYERVLLEQKSDLCVVVGDVTSSMACAIAAQKLYVPVAHVEGGIRSGDWSMPEEINRIVTDSITNWFFTTSETANQNLRIQGVREEQIFFVGNTMIDTLFRHLSQLKKPLIWDEAQLISKNYFVVTLHRPANVDGEYKLKSLLDEIISCSRRLPVIFPVHPRTAKNLEQSGLSTSTLFLTEPLGYLEFNYLVKNALAVITDSGGITEETTVLGIPCMTLRDNTERPETITQGTNELVGTDPQKLKLYFDRLFAGQWKKGTIPELWDGQSGERIVQYIEKILGYPRTHSQYLANTIQ